ncbi:vacuolar protein sorting-associated protein 4 [Colletotrichum liriopes]|uniref:vesicle-fusing ATPase n=1 Tax=Colletotrichum liriopes TaxID=708192 RepID=A0AA37GUW2_9PEZI|nr:vacuolar protein sorting-associated protein 4 [Colletotrichum liriopes]
MSGITDFLGRAISTVKQAIDADNAAEYEKAFQLYTKSLELFVLAVKWEKNAKSKELIRQKTAEYMDRAEKLKTYLNEAEAKKSGGGGGGGNKPGAMGVNGGGKGKANDDVDEDNKKLRNALSGAILQERPNVRWDDVAGLEGAKDTLKEAVVLPIKFPSLFQGKRQAWKGILLYGPPGTGKSYLAKAVATEANSTFFSVSSSDLARQGVVQHGERKQALGPLHRRNRRPLRPRGEGESEASRRIKTELLVQMDGVGNDSKGILVLGATNIPWQLDAAIRRRFQRRVHIGLPDVNGRARMFKLAVGDTETNLQQDDYRVLAELSEGFSGSDISNVVQQALMGPVRKIIQATHFKPVMHDGVKKLTPCSPGDPDAKEMTYHDVDSEELMAPTLELKDFKQALRDSHPTVSEDDAAKQIEWTNEFGSEGA